MIVHHSEEMSSFNSTADREWLKANARNLREKEVLQNQERLSQKQPLFGPPIKKSSSEASYISSILGSYDKVQPALQNGGSALYGCGTPVSTHPACPDGGPLFPPSSGSFHSTEKQNSEHRVRSHSKERPPTQNSGTSHNRSNDFKPSSSSYSTYLNSDKNSVRTDEFNRKDHSQLAKDVNFQNNYKERSLWKSSSRPHGQDNISKGVHQQQINNAADVTSSNQNKDPSAMTGYHTNHSSSRAVSPPVSTAKADSTFTSAFAKADSTTEESSASKKSIPSTSDQQSIDIEIPFQSPLQSAEKLKLPKQSPTCTTDQSQHFISSHVHTKSTVKPLNGIVHNGVIRSEPQHKSKPKRSIVSKLWLPRHDTSQNGKEQLHVRHILEEMNLHPPLTGIHTPKKDDSSGFPFPGLDKIFQSKGQSDSETGNGSKEALESVTGATPEGQASTRPVNKPMCVSQGSSQALSKELEISSDSEDDEQDTNIIKKQFPRKPLSLRKRSRTSVMSASLSSSSGSESSDSESSSCSDSSGSEGEEEKGQDHAAELSKPAAASSPLPTPTGKGFSWALANFRQDISMEGPGNLISTEDTSHHIVNPNSEDISINTSSLIDKSNTEALDALSYGLDKLVNSVPSLLSPMDSKTIDLSVPFNVGIDIEKENECDNSQEINLVGSGSLGFTECNVNLDISGKAVKLKIPNRKLNDESKSNSHSDIPRSTKTKSPSATSVKSTSSGITKASNKSSRKTSVSSEKIKVPNSKTEEKVKSKRSRSKSDISNNKKTSTKSEKTGNATPKGSTTPKVSSVPKGLKKGKTSPKGFTSKEFISTSESSSDDESCIVDVETISPLKMNGNISQTGAVSKQSHSPPVICKSPKSVKKNLSFASQKSEKKSSNKSSPEKSKLKDKTNLTDLKNYPKTRSRDDSLMSALDVVTDIFPMPEPLLSPIPNLEASSIKSLPGITIVNGKPSIMVRIDLSKLDRIPARRESENTMSNRQSDNAGLLVQSEEKIKPVKHEVKTSPAERVYTEKQTSKSSTAADDSSSVPKSETYSDIGIKLEDTPESEIAAPVECVRTNGPSAEVDSAPIVVNATVSDTASGSVYGAKPSLPKIPKRKSVGEDKGESKRIKMESSRKSTPKRKSEILTDQKESVSHEDDHEWDRKHPRRSSERRNSTSSNSSRHSSNRSDKELNHDTNSRERWDKKRDKWDKENRDSNDKDVSETDHESVQNRDSKPARDSYKSGKDRVLSQDKDLLDRDCNKDTRDRERSKDRERLRDSRDHNHHQDCDRDQEREQNRTREHDREQRHNRLCALDATNTVNGHSEEGSVAGHQVGNEWSPLLTVKELPLHHYSSSHDQLPSQEPSRKAELFPEEKGLQDFNHYLSEAKNLKRQASNASDALGKVMKYIEAVLSFLLCGHCLERDTQDNQRIFSMYKDTHSFAKGFGNKYFGTSDSSRTDDMKKLFTLLLKIQAIVSLKLYHSKKLDVIKLKKAIDDHNSKPPPAKPSAQAPSPYQGGWNKSSTGTPSPMSPQPSPVGSTSSLGSQGSSGEICTSRLTNGIGTSSSTVTVPSRIHSITHNYITYVQYLVQSDDLWEQSDTQAKKYKAYFDILDCQCGGPLTIHSSILSLVRYVRCGLHRLKDT